MMLRKSGFPIFFYHVGNLLSRDSARFLDLALSQAAVASPENDVVLVTDQIQRLPDTIIQVRATRFKEAASAFESAYVHFSQNPELYELHCYLRWFYFRAIARALGVNQLCVFDSDIMLFSPARIFAREFDGYGAGDWTWANFFADPGALDLMCEYFQSVYRDRAALSNMVSEQGGVDRAHISDMYLLRRLAAGNGRFLDQTSFPAKGFDDNIHSSHKGMFRMDGDMKSLSLDAGGVPIARRVSDNGAVPFHFLHFQGYAKTHMRRFAWANNRVAD